MKIFSKVKKYIAITAFTLLSCKAFGALPPMPESLREIEAILSHEFLKSPEMTAETIVQIQKTERGFILETTHFVIPIEIISLPQENLGPAPLDVQFDLSKLIAKE